MTAAAAAAVCVLVAAALALPDEHATLSARLRHAAPSRRRMLLADVLHRRRRARAASSGIDPTLVLELVAAALAAGSHPAAALTTVGQAVGGEDGAALRSVGERMELGAGEATVWAAAPGCGEDLRRCLSLSERTGAPASLLLREAAAEGRRARRRAAETAAHRVGVRLVLPLGLCALPAFTAWGVIPVVLGLAGAVVLPR